MFEYIIIVEKAERNYSASCILY